MSFPTPARLASLSIFSAFLLITGACKDLNTDLGRNVYERELEDLFQESPAGVIGTTADTHLVVFRENSFVAEPSIKGSGGETSQGMRFLREASFRLAEARANTVEGVIALREAGFSEHAISQMFPDANDWTEMYMQTIERAQSTIADELNTDVLLEELLRGAERGSFDVERERIHGDVNRSEIGADVEVTKVKGKLEMARIQADVEITKAELAADVAHHEADVWQAVETSHAGADLALGQNQAGGDCGDFGKCDDFEDDGEECVTTRDCAPDERTDQGAECGVSDEVDQCDPSAPCSDATDCPSEQACEVGCTKPCCAVGVIAAPNTSGLSIVSLSSPALVPLHLPPAKASFGGTPTLIQADETWNISYGSPARTGQTVDLVVTCLDAQDDSGAAQLTATFTIKVDATGMADLDAKLPKGWRLVRLDSPGAKPLFALFM